MRPMFLIALLTLLSCTQTQALKASDNDIQVISTTPESFADELFIGSDRDMPHDQPKVMAISPTKVGTQFFVPGGFAEAFQELDRMLPNWYKTAMASGHGDHECSVVINDRALDVPLYSWIEVNWRLEEQDSRIGQAFRSYGIRRVETMIEALQTGFCTYLKQGAAAGIDAMKPYRAAEAT
jgi:hypothetical protein